MEYGEIKFQLVILGDDQTALLIDGQPVTSPSTTNTFGISGRGGGGGKVGLAPAEGAFNKRKLKIATTSRYFFIPK